MLLGLREGGSQEHHSRNSTKENDDRVVDTSGSLRLIVTTNMLQNGLLWIRYILESCLAPTENKHQRFVCGNNDAFLDFSSVRFTLVDPPDDASLIFCVFHFLLDSIRGRLTLRIKCESRS